MASVAWLNQALISEVCSFQPCAERSHCARTADLKASVSGVTAGVGESCHQQIVGRLEPEAAKAAWSEMEERLGIFATNEGWVGPNASFCLRRRNVEARPQGLIPLPMPKINRLISPRVSHQSPVATAAESRVADLLPHPVVSLMKNSPNQSADLQCVA